MSNSDHLTSRKVRSVTDAVARLSVGSTLEQAVANLLLSLKADRRRPKTLVFYQFTLTRFATWMAEEHYPTDDLKKIQALHIKLFLAYIEENPRRASATQEARPALPATVHAYGRALRHFLNWLVDEGLIDENPMTGPRPNRPRVKLPQVPDALIHPFTEDQIESLLAQCDPNTALGARDAALILTMLDTGMRASEVCDLRLDEYNPMTGAFTVQGAKGGGERVGVLRAGSRRAMGRWLTRWRAMYGTPPDTIVLSLRGRAPAPLTPNGLYQIIARLGEAAGITDARCSPHTLRHTFACFYLLNGGDLESLRQLMGHATVKMTLRYLHLRGQHLEDLHRRFAPTSRLDQAAIGRLRRAAQQDSDQATTPAGVCRVPDCGRAVKALGLCSGHHQRQRLHGDVQADVPLQRRKPDPPTKACDQCGRAIPIKALRTHPDQRYCGADCARVARYDR